MDDVDSPLTIADPVAGVGALQFSPAIYKAGRLPQIGPEDLSELLDEFACKQGLEGPFDHSIYPGEVAIEGASFHAEDDLIRVWYATDGKNVMLITYVCNWDYRDQEACEREMIVRSVRFGM
ncbi:MAG: hypothetical protein JOZ17_07405 [Acetobacteraceae bacterium]|nr:hypothetical protein [Acetobacteraceae bacterium]